MNEKEMTMIRRTPYQMTDTNYLAEYMRIRAIRETPTKQIKEKPIKKIKKILIGIFLILSTSLLFQSCSKEPWQAPGEQETTPYRELITTTFNLSTAIKDIDMNSKSFNPDLWVYNYSTTQFELKFTNQWSTYTKQVSINELKSGSVSMTMYSGTYNVSSIQLIRPYILTN
jgi:hypothetical protein